MSEQTFDRITILKKYSDKSIRVSVRYAGTNQDNAKWVQFYFSIASIKDILDGKIEKIVKAEWIPKEKE